MHDLLDQVTCLLIIHRPDLLDLLVIGLLELFKAFLKLDVFIRKLLVLLGVVCVQVFGISHLGIKQFLFVSESIFVLVEFELQALLLLVEDLLALEEHIIVEAKLLLVELVDSLHVFHALFEDLHFGLELDLLLGLLVRILAHDFFKRSRVSCLLTLALLLIKSLNTFLFLELLLDLLFVSVKD